MPCKRAIFLILFLAFPSPKAVHAQRTSYREQDVHQQKMSVMFQYNLGYYKDRLKDDSFLWSCLEGDFRLEPMVFSILGDRYIQSQFPISVYYFNPNGATAYALDIKYRAEIGPRTKLGVLWGPEISYLYNNKDWFSGNEDQQTHTILTGIFARFVLKDLNNGVVEIGGGGTPWGDNFFRFR